MKYIPGISKLLLRRQLLHNVLFIVPAISFACYDSTIHNLFTSSSLHSHNGIVQDIMKDMKESLLSDGNSASEELSRPSDVMQIECCEDDDDVPRKGKSPCLNEPMKYFISISLGIAGGAALNLLHASKGVVTLSTVPGQLFLRALQCAVRNLHSAQHHTTSSSLLLIYSVCNIDYD